jgi:uncharacterized damage-inducible protein DinB
MRRTLVAILLAACAFAQDKPTTPAPPPAAPASFRQVFLNRLQDTETKLVSLTEATPQEKLTWRPGEGVRSVSEVFMHIAGSNYFFLTPLGVKPPAGLNMGAEKSVTAQADIVAALKKSFAHVRTAVEGMSDADMSKATKMFGQSLTYEGVLFVMANHMHEHFGQSIAYARTNGIVPPWSQKKEN